MIAVISALSLGIAFLVITWNKRLRNTVNTKTIELKDANEQLKAHGKMQKEFINIANTNYERLRKQFWDILKY